MSEAKTPYSHTFTSPVRFADIESDFKAQLKSLIPEIFRADNENFVKEINGQQITATQLFEYFKVSSEPALVSLLYSHGAISRSDLLCRVRLGQVAHAQSHARSTHAVSISLHASAR